MTGLIGRKLSDADYHPPRLLQIQPLARPCARGRARWSGQRLSGFSSETRHH